MGRKFVHRRDSTFYGRTKSWTSDQAELGASIDNGCKLVNPGTRFMMPMMTPSHVYFTQISTLAQHLAAGDEVITLGHLAGASKALFLASLTHRLRRPLVGGYLNRILKLNYSCMISTSSPPR